MSLDFLRAYPPERPGSEQVVWLLFRGGDLLAITQEDRLTLLRGEAATQGLREGDEPLYLGVRDGVAYLACEVSDDAVLPEACQPFALRALFGRLPDPEYALTGYASQLLHWRRISRYCGVCGQPTEAGVGDWGRRCAACGHTQYPQVSPAVLALVHDGDRILLAHKPGWGKRYSILAGFVEPGESLEECVRREVHEEAGVAVGDIAYAGSQPWPFPSQLMVGFTARWAGGALRIDDKELDHAAWFSVDALPELPAPLSLSRQLIDRWAASAAARAPTRR